MILRFILGLIAGVLAVGLAQAAYVVWVTRSWPRTMRAVTHAYKATRNARRALTWIDGLWNRTTTGFYERVGTYKVTGAPESPHAGRYACRQIPTPDEGPAPSYHSYGMAMDLTAPGPLHVPEPQVQALSYEGLAADAVDTITERWRAKQIAHDTEHATKRQDCAWCRANLTDGGRTPLAEGPMIHTTSGEGPDCPACDSILEQIRP